MIAEDPQVLFAQDFEKSVRSPIITTGNELVGEAIVVFSKKLDIGELYRYALEVMESTKRTNTILSRVFINI